MEVALLLAADHLDGAPDLVHAGEDALDLLVEAQALGGGREAAAAAVEQLEAGVGFQVREELADGGLGHVEGLGGAADGAELDDSLEGLDLAEVGGARHRGSSV